MSTSSRFWVEAAPTPTGPGVCTLLVGGEADLTAADQLKEAGETALADAGTTTLVLDLQGVTFIDSTALGALIHIRNRAETEGKQLRLTRLPERVQRILAITGLTTVFEIVPAEQHQR
jgi:anti-sigma B factor antagonist